MMAHYPPERVDAIVDRWGLPAFTDETITDRETLIEELEAVREEGIAFNREEYLRGVLAVGVPVFDADESVCGAVTVAGPVRRLYSGREPEALHDALLAAANTIEVNLVVSE
jgi:DNA-binding IclR family transcriptional regulator